MVGLVSFLDKWSFFDKTSRIARPNFSIWNVLRDNTSSSNHSFFADSDRFAYCDVCTHKSPSFDYNLSCVIMPVGLNVMGQDYGSHGYCYSILNRYQLRISCIKYHMLTYECIFCVANVYPPTSHIRVELHALAWGVELF